jgi:TolB-like protein/Flp pilus assembly protein TadD
MALNLRVLGDIEVERDGEPVALPPSRKTRALLAYLVVTGRPHRRDRLCSLLWDIPDDPRGALRWSLSKLRPLVNEPGAPRIVTDKETVAFEAANAQIDLFALRARLADGVDAVSTAQLQDMVAAFRGDFLEGLDLSDCHDFQSWCVAEREQARSLRKDILNTLVARLSAQPAEVLPYARRLVELEPFDEPARAGLVRLLAKAGRREEAEQQYLAGCGLFRELGTDGSGELEAAWRELRDAGTTAVTANEVDAMASQSDGLTVPDKPSIAVLPFENLSGDPDQEYFADGVAEDIIAGISRVRWLFVIARHSSFTYKGEKVDVKRVGQELGVRYVLDGSVRKAASERVRVATQLIDATNGKQIWAERYDRVLEDIFAVQDEITEAIVAAIEPELGKAEQRRAHLKKPEDLGAWDLYQQGMWHLYRRTRVELTLAEQLFHRALERDQTLTPALAGLVDAYYYLVVFGLTDTPTECREKAIVAARMAVELDPDDASAHCAMGKARIFQREHQAAIPELERALELNPSLAWAYYGLGAAAVFSGKSASEAIPNVERAIRLSPRDLHLGSFMVRLADAYLASGEYEKAAEWARKSLRQPNFQWSRYAVLLAALGHLGQVQEAWRVLDELLALRPDFSIPFVRETHLYTNNDTFTHYLEGLRKAGVAE